MILRKKIINWWKKRFLIYKLNKVNKFKKIFKFLNFFQMVPERARRQIPQVLAN
jgi:hypothetical protein